MSNKIFQASINFLVQAVFNRLIKNLNFKRREKENLASGFVEGKNVSIYHENKLLTIIIPNEKLTEEECRRIAKKILIELYKLEGIELGIEEIEIKMLGFASGICNYCLIKTISYKCRRCLGYYCSKHRLPENHDCPGERKLEFRIKEKYKKKRERDDKSKKVVIVESHCG